MLKYSITLKEVENHVEILHSVLFHCWTEKCPLSDENWVPRVKEDLINLFLRFTWSEHMLLQIYQCFSFSKKLFTSIVTKNNISQNVICSQYMITIFGFSAAVRSIATVRMLFCCCVPGSFTLSVSTLDQNSWGTTTMLTILCWLCCFHSIAE